jgi:hypothetical protein
MQRDPRVQAKILEELGDAGQNEILVGLDEYSPEAFYYNARQLHRERLIDIQDRGTLADSLACWATGLTPKWHDALDQAKDEWQRKAKAAGGRAVQITFESVLSAILDKMLK